MELESVNLREHNWHYEDVDLSIVMSVTADSKKEAISDLRKFINKIKKDKVTIGD